MKNIAFFIISFLFTSFTWAQANTDSTVRGIVTVTKDDRIDLLGKRMAEYNESLANKIKMQRGYRLMLLSTIDRNQAIQLRSNLLQQFPEHGVYMIFQSPYIKIKMGNFIEREDAEKARKSVANAKLVSGNIYIVPEMVEVKPDKNKPLTTEN